VTSDERRDFLSNINKLKKKKARQKRVEGVKTPFHIREGFKREKRKKWEDATAREQRNYLKAKNKKGKELNKVDEARLKEKRRQEKAIKKIQKEKQKRIDKSKRDREKALKKKQKQLRKKRKEVKKRLEKAKKRMRR